MSEITRGIYVFYQYEGTGILTYSFFDGGNWTMDQRVLNTCTNDCPAVVFHNNKIYCIHQGADDCGSSGNHQFWCNVLDGAAWTGDKRDYNIYLNYAPSATLFNNQIYVSHQGADSTNAANTLWYTVYQGGGNWQADSQVPNTTLEHSPSVIAWDGKLLCFHRGYGGASNQLWYNTYQPGNGWLGDNYVPGTYFTGSPAAVVYNGSLYVFYQSADGSNALRRARFRSDMSVADDQALPGTTLWYSPAPCVFNNRLYCFHHAGSSDQVLYCSVWLGQNWIGDFQVPNVSVGTSPSVVVVD